MRCRGDETASETDPRATAAPGDFAPHLAFHAADANQLVQDEERTVDPVVAIHPFLLGQGLVKTFLGFLKGLLLEDRQRETRHGFCQGFFRMGDAHVRGIAALPCTTVAFAFLWSLSAW